MVSRKYILTKKTFKVKHFILLFILFSLPLSSFSQIGSHRSELSLGLNTGYVLSNVGFIPKVSQSFHGGITIGVSAKYVCEKYFNTICSILGEVNYSSIGWKEDILNNVDMPVINSKTGLPEKYQRTINYIQVPLFAHLAWGKEQKGFQFFLQAGPQFGIYLNESTQSNFSFKDIDVDSRSNTIIAQDTMSVERKFDYGIAAGAGVEYSFPKIGHLMLEARYYYGLSNIYHDSKKDFFGRSNFGNIIIKLTYLIDIFNRKTKI